VKTFLLASEFEKARAAHVAGLLDAFPGAQLVEAIYPAFAKVPFCSNIMAASKERTGHQMNHGEIGCLLSHRRIWQRIKKEAATDEEAFLVLESDSRVINKKVLVEKFNQVHEQYDFFFWGAFDGRTKLLRSTRTKIDQHYVAGTPLVNSLYCTYGYSLNKKAAVFLLESTRKVSYPVDHWKRRLNMNIISVGSVLPQLIGAESDFESSIQFHKKTGGFSRYLFDKMIDLKNRLICLVR
jgi:glycosyl transferase family 25